MPYSCPVPYAGVICPVHGYVDISHAEYENQMNRPNSLWTCPICRSNSNFDDHRFEALNPEPGYPEET